MAWPARVFYHPRYVVQQPDQVIAGKYQLVRRLARGGMGAVWLARHLELDIDVALKFPRSDHAPSGIDDERFRREARAAAGLRSPHVVLVHDFGFDGRLAYITMECLRGEDLREHLGRRGALSLSEARSIAIQAAKALISAHEKGIVHRDIKPSNIFLAEEQGEIVVKVLDFGIAKSETPEGGEETTRGQVFGSPAYMSPEQVRGEKVDARTDLWSLGAVFFEMLVGRAPFSGSSPGDIAVNVCTGDVPLPSSHDGTWADEVDDIVRRALRRRREHRFQTAADMLAALEQLPSVDGVQKTMAKRNSTPGRTDETAPLAVPVEAAKGGDEEVRSSPLASERELRPSILPQRPRPSSLRGIWAVAGMLLLLGAAGILSTVSGREGHERRSVVHSQAGPQEGRRDIARVEGAKAPEQTGKLEETAPGSSDDASSVPQERTRSVETAPTAPPPDEANEISGHSARPQPSRQAPTPVEAKEDPVFGLPVESP